MADDNDNGAVKRDRRVPGRVSASNPQAIPAPLSSGKQSSTQHLPEGPNGQYRAATLRLPDSLRAELEAATGTSLGDVAIHDGEEGHATAQAHGANAVAIDNEIFFKRGAYQPDTRGGRELIAHEVAHIVQARGPRVLQLKPGAAQQEQSVDAAEREAEGFAGEFGDRGGSARWTPTVGVSAGTAMRSPEGQPAVAAVRTAMKSLMAANKPDVAWAYLRKNEEQFFKAIEVTLLALPLPQDPRFTWIHNALPARFRAAVTAALAGNPVWIKLPELVNPVDPWYTIDQNRPLTEGAPGVSVDGKDAVGPLTWVDLTGAALSSVVYKALADSLRRMVPRFAIQIDWKAPEPVKLEDLVTSHPMDRVTANLLLDPAVTKATPSKAAKPEGKRHEHPGDKENFKYSIRFLKDWRWLNSVDSRLWNWLEAKDPKDATAEEVAATLWGDLSATQYAYVIRKSGPYFRVDPPYARRFAAAPQYELDEKHKDNALDLAGSSIATDAAIAQAHGERHLDKAGHVLPPDLKKLGATLKKSQRQLERVKRYFTTPKLWMLVQPALSWVIKYRENLTGVSDQRLQDLTPVIEGQSQILFEATGAITEISAMGDARALQDEKNPVFNTLREYATVCGESQLVESARAHLQIARQSKMQLPIALLEMSASDTGTAVNELAQSRSSSSPVMQDRQRNLSIDNHRIAFLRAQQAMGQKVNPDLVTNVAASLKEQAVDSRVESLYEQIAALRNAASDSKFGFFETVATIFDSDIRSLPGTLNNILTDLKDTVQEPHKRNKEQQLKAAGQDMNAQTYALNDVARMTERSLSEFVARNNLKAKMEAALQTIEKQQIRTAVVRIITQILVLIATSVVAGFIGNVVAGAVRGAMVADAATASIGMLRTARVVGGLAGMTVDAGINAGVQVAVQGGDAKEAFVGNFLGAGVVRAALTPLTKAAQTWGAIGHEVEAVGKWEKIGRASKFVAYQGAHLTVSMVVGSATDYVVHRLYHSGEPVTEKQAVDWAIQGGSMAIGMFVGHWTRGFEQRAVAAAEQFGYKTMRERTFNIRKLAAHVEKTGNPDEALELLGKRHEALEEEARVIDEATRAAKGKPSTLLETMRAGNAKDMAEVKDAAFAQVPMRLAGLQPEDSSGKIWAGTTEEIAIALHQAKRAGIHVEIELHDSAARQWKVRYNNEEITIIETKAEGRPRPANADATDADRVRARRYAEAAAFMQDKWEAKVKADYDRLDVIEVDHMQVGYAYAGVVNQATLPAHGQGLDNKVVVYKHKGTLSGRGEQELGQPPTKFDAPGVRATEQSPKDAPWIKSKELDASLDIGRLENQTPTYRGEAVALQTKETAPPGDPWKAEKRKFRIKIRDADGVERWFYCDKYDNVGGLGPGSTKELEKIVIDETLRKSMMAGDPPLLLLGDDPDYVHKVKRGNILIWGGTPTGAWAAEPVKANRGSRATVLGDSRPPTPTEDWARLFKEYNDIRDSISVVGEHAPADLRNRLATIEAMITDAHAGAKIPRNRKPGATYEKPPTDNKRGDKDVRVEFGTPTEIKPTADGKVMVTIGTGQNKSTRVYDQVVMAHGQDPSKGPAAMLGKGAALVPGADPKKREYGEVPQGTIALKPIWGPKDAKGRQQILGLESIDPAGIVLKGAAYANKKLSPWIAKKERAAFEHEVDAMSAENAVTRDYGAISPDSHGVSPGMEVQRDRIPRANEVLHAGSLRLPGPDKTLELGPDQATWDDKVREFFVINLKADDRWVSVKRLGGGATNAIVYHVSVDGNEVGIFKLFGPADGAITEQRTLDMLQAAKLKKMKVVGGRGTIKLDGRSGYSGAVLMDVAKGTTVKEMVQSMPVDINNRRRSMEVLTHAVEKVAEGLAEMHVKFGDNSSKQPTMMTETAKKSDADWFLEKAFNRGRDRTRQYLGDDLKHVEQVARGTMYKDFMAAEVPATLYHGDANAGNFALSGNNNSQVSMFDVDKTRWSVPDGTLGGPPGKVTGTRTGAADIARFLNSLETLAPGKLRPDELQALHKAFKDVYFRNYRVGSDQHKVARGEYEKAERWYLLEMEMAIIDTPGAKERIMKIVGPKKKDGP